MEFVKRIVTIIIIALIAVFAFVYAYIGINRGAVVFADSTTDNWQNVTTNAQMVDAFRYYCKSRDLTIEGSALDVVTSFTTQTYNNICNGLGFDMTALQSHLKYRVDNTSGNIEYLFDATGITAYNQIFAQFLQDNELAVGDTVNNKDVFNAETFTDVDGYTCVVYILKSDAPNYSPAGLDYILNEGTYYKYSTDQLKSYAGSSLTWNYASGVSFTRTVYARGSSYNGYTDLYSFSSSSWGDLNNRIYAVTDNTALSSKEFKGYKAVFRRQNASSYYFGNICYTYDWNDDVSAIAYDIRNNSMGTAQDINITINNVYLTTNNNTINNNNYEGDTIINNYGTPSQPTTPTPTPTPDYDPAEDWDIDLPDLSVPNWILSGKENKFPFDIPFNVMYALTLLQAEPEAPEVEGTIDFGFYQWDYDLDLSQFDTVASICRDMEFLAFLTGLMLMTRKLIWG